MLKNPFDVISKNTKGAITEGNTYTVLRISLRREGQYYQIVGDNDEKVKYHSKNFIKMEDLEGRGM